MRLSLKFAIWLNASIGITWCFLYVFWWWAGWWFQQLEYLVLAWVGLSTARWLSVEYHKRKEWK